MKFLLGLNFLAIGIPLLLALLSLSDGSFSSEALLSTMFTGVAQVVIALILFALDPKDKRLYVYFSITIVFFIVWLGFNITNNWIFSLPPALALFLTYILISTYISRKNRLQ